jgi:hypothetical protein
MTGPDFVIFDVLRKHAVPFVIVGGHAVNFHGFIRATEDTDIVWNRSAESEVALSAALDELEARYIGNDIDPATRIERTYPVSLGYIQTHPLMMLCTRCGFLDLFSYIPGFPQIEVAELFNSSIEHDGLRFASKNWLIQMKTAAGRTRDLIDLENLA